ncbi:MAG: hypothetical protein ISS19_18770 [Bacteroidales bacterium]|nr:hypothetical protein [Bacteroidales bacterium]
MENRSIGSPLSIALTIGAIWGLSEVALGIGLRACAAQMSGSLMTGAGLFFLSAGWIASRRFFVPILIVCIVSVFKLFDALLLMLPVTDGAIINPIFAFLTEGAAITLLLVIFKSNRLKKLPARILLGGGSALIAVALFPLVKFATGVPACLYPGTTIPLSVYFAPVAIVTSMVLVPLGFFTGEKISVSFKRFDEAVTSAFARLSFSPVIAMVCLALVMFIRMFTS